LLYRAILIMSPNAASDRRMFFSLLKTVLNTFICFHPKAPAMASHSLLIAL